MNSSLFRMRNSFNTEKPAGKALVRYQSSTVAMDTRRHISINSFDVFQHCGSVKGRDAIFDTVQLGQIIILAL